MPEFQTAVKSDLNILRGSAKIEISPYQASPSFTEIGGITGLSVVENLEVNAEEYDNADSEQKITNQTVTISFNWIELLDVDVYTILRGDTDTISQTSEDTTILTGNKTDLTKFILRLITKNGGNTHVFTFYKCTLNKGFEFPFAADDGEDRRVLSPTEILAQVDSTYNTDVDGNGLLYARTYPNPS